MREITTETGRWALSLSGAGIVYVSGPAAHWTVEADAVRLEQVNPEALPSPQIPRLVLSAAWAMLDQANGARRQQERAMAIAPGRTWTHDGGTSTAWLLADYHAAYIWARSDAAGVVIRGLRYETRCREPAARARSIARWARAYLQRWREPDALRLRETMRFRREAVASLLRATGWALITGAT